MIREVGRNLGTKSLDDCFEVSNAFDPTVRRFVPSLPIHREKERECRRDRRAQIYIYIYIYRSTRADIRTSFSIRDRKWLRANWRALYARLLLLGPPLPAQLFGVSRVTDHARDLLLLLLGKIGPLLAK